MPTVLYPSSPGERLSAVLERLGPATRQPLPLGNKPDPYDELIYIILTVMTRSQQRIDHAYDCLVEMTGGDWSQLAILDEDRLRQALKPLGFVTRRTTQLRNISSRVSADHGGSLDSLRDMSDDAALAYLVSLPGVGVKTAKCVLMYSLGRDVLPVDIHVLRVAKRLSLVEPDASWTQTGQRLDELTPAGSAFDVHVRFVQHGREVCKSRGARCSECPLLSLCPAGPLPPDRRADYL